jgi:aspartate carbamoyltransferase catalytic subunit
MPALSKVLQQCRNWKEKHLLGTRDFSRSQIEQILKLSLDLKRTAADEIRAAAPLKGRRVFNFFAEPSTRTKTSFSIAARQLGAEVLDFSPATSSLTKGETLKDTAQVIESMGVDFVVIRHAASGAPHFLARQVRGAVLNAGDGMNEHPTQALLDLLTMHQAVGRVAGIRIALVGDIAHSRVARSNLWLHRTLGNEVILCGPATMVPRDLPARIEFRLDEVLPECDVVMMLRLQLERQQAGLFPSPTEYERFFGLTRERLALLKKGAIVMHPGPMNRGLEISGEAADGSASVILDQVANGVTVRMAVLLLLQEALR